MEQWSEDGGQLCAESMGDSFFLRCSIMRAVFKNKLRGFSSLEPKLKLKVVSRIGGENFRVGRTQI